jgi:hypothetical protein
MASLSESVDIVWLRDDFRLNDQPAIHAAARAPDACGVCRDARPLSTSDNSGHLAHLPVADRDPAVHAGGEVHVVGGDEGREATCPDQRG